MFRYLENKCGKQQQRYSRLIPGAKKNRAGNNLKPERIVGTEVSPAEPVVREKWGMTLQSMAEKWEGSRPKGRGARWAWELSFVP